ncbi:hypothetical protein SAMN02745116_01567 [Pilibacter termitis]|uniref:Uncharacterized protein n=1 Tax=Pilibacter termitis TaxID=263852 RepID=A0A1T4NX69_9ENTE|nr:SPJ_0845 family protein [Pilibacter termitis]SJZ83646.1 hypothetical protein SAMN02745116_01567 [Pilibacter termitis]
MGLKFTKVDDWDKMFEKFAVDPDKVERNGVKADVVQEDEEKRKNHLGIKEETHEEKKIIK